MGLEWMSSRLEGAIEGIVENIKDAILPGELEKGVSFERIEANEEKLEGVEKNAEGEKVFGNPEKDMENWHRQSEPYSCAVACQEYIAEQFFDENLSEKKMIEYANKKGWYDANDGTSANDVGKLLETMGLQVERNHDGTLKQLIDELESGGKIICGVNNMVLQNPDYAEIPGVRANHAVQVIGVDCSDPQTSYVILNDPGVMNGQGRRVELSTFMKAWDTGDNFTVVARKGANA